MCSASSRITRSRMSSPTSTSSRSAPLPPRSTRIACSWSSAWVTEAPLSMAILVAVVSWPFNVPTMRSRMVIFCSQPWGAVSLREPLAAFGLDDFRHGHAKLVFHQHHLAARHQAVVDVDVDGFADAAVEFEHGAGSEFQQFADIHLGAAEHRRNLHRHVKHRFQVGGDARGLLVLVVGHVIGRRHVGGVEIGKRNLCVGVTHGSILMVLSRGLIAGRHVASNKFVDLCLDSRALQHDAAIGPLDLAIAGVDVRLRQDHETAGEAALLGQPLDPLARGLVERVIDPDHEMRGRDQVREAIAHQRADLAERLAGNQFAGELARHRHRDVDGLGLHPCRDAGKACRDALESDRDLLKRQRGAAVAFRLGLALSDLVTVAIGAGLGRSDSLRNFRRRRWPLAPLVRGGEIDVEQEFCGSGHQYTSSSSARFLVSMISPLAARSLARLTSSACASSTSRNRTGPSAAMSSSSILPARDDIWLRKKPRTSSLALFKAMPSLSLSMWRIRVCAEAESSLTRSSKVNISSLMRSADSRFSSSSEVMKRISVWRSKLLKISAITSWASRRRVCDRFDMNSVRSVCSTRSITSFCTASILSMRLTTSSAMSSGRIASTRAACSGLSFDSTTAMVCGYSFLR